MHTSAIRAAGGSVALTLPQALVKVLGLRAGDTVHLASENGKLIVSPMTRKCYTAADLVAMQGDAPLWVDAEWDACAQRGHGGAADGCWHPNWGRDLGAAVPHD